ncbi:MAG: O-antigen ligase family protein [Acidimicrobiales bacterium]
MTATLVRRSPRPFASGRADRTDARRRRLPYGWPLDLMFYGYPLWWMLGMHSFIWQLAAIPLAGQLLIDRRRVRVPRGFGVWMLFLLWFLASVSGLERTEQLGPFAHRFSLYLSATVLLIFALNAPRELLSLRRIYGMLAAFFVTVVAGGWLGVLIPNGGFKSGLELILPGSLAENPFIRPLIHPQFAQVQTFLGFPLGRPQAPFAYTNHWGSAYALLVPIVILGWARMRRSGIPLAAQLLLIVSLVPAIVSLNRGMFLSLIIALIYASLRSGRVAATARRVVGGLVVVVMVLLVVTPLGQLVSDRSENAHSNEGRGTLYEQAVDYTNRRPILGYGAPQEVEGDLLLPPVGTQGHFWMVMVSTGYVGLGLFLAFVIQLGRLTRKVPQQVSVCHLLIVIVLVQMFVYDLSIAPMQIVFLCVGIALREAEADRATDSTARRTHRFWPSRLGGPKQIQHASVPGIGNGRASFVKGHPPDVIDLRTRSEVAGDHTHGPVTHPFRTTPAVGVLRDAELDP